MNPYGHAPTLSLLRGRRAEELLAGGRTARRDAARGQPADPLPRAAVGHAAARPLGPAGRTDGGRAAVVRVGAAPACARGTAPPGCRAGLRDAEWDARARRVDRSGRLGRARVVVRVRR